MSSFHLFDISLYQLNIFSFMLGMTYTVCGSYYHRSAIKTVIAYWMILGAYYAFLYYSTQPK